MSTRLDCWTVLFESPISTLIFCVLALWVLERGMLESLIIVVDLFLLTALSVLVSCILKLCY